VKATALIAGILLIAIVLWDAFETIILSRRVSRKLRLTRLFYWLTWRPWRAVAARMRPGNPRENYLSIYGPLSLIVLLVLWAVGLIFAFALIQSGLGSRLAAPPGTTGFFADLYMSGGTFFTLGYGDVTPLTPAGRILSVIEAGTGFGFLALVIGYLPTLSQAFSRREANIALLDARAGSPPTAAELLRRHAGDHDSLADLLAEWERWSAELLESHVSFPVLAYYRSQHDNQSWVSALTTILDTCALVIVGMEGRVAGAARLTFAMARHAVVDLAQIFSPRKMGIGENRLHAMELARLRERLAESNLEILPTRDSETRLTELRSMYERHAEALSRHLLMPLPAWTPPSGAPDNWQTMA
jgi:voltage-gated potassium channel Kch